MKKLGLFFLLISLSGFSQEKILNGKVEVPWGAPKGVSVENISREIQTQTDASGSFSIEAKAGDALIFSSVAIKKRVFFVKEEHFESPPLIKLSSDNVELDQVEITAEQIKLKEFSQKELTAAEKRYRRSGRVLSFDQGIVFNLEAVGNLFNGKRKQLKKEVRIAQKQLLKIELDNYFDDVFYTETLGLDKEYIEDFKFFMVDDPEFSAILKTKDENKIYEGVLQVYDAYLKINSGEK
ncbi:MAG: hypothetical protein WCY89_11340 [Flavobacteriaceae bacterium]